MNPSYLPVLKRICQDVRRDMVNRSIEENEIDWDVNVEVLFFYAMLGYKPVGVNRHFMMLLIHNRFTGFLNHQLSSKALWDHLDTMYDMPSLHESEIIPFPNEEVDFELPEECHDLLLSKHGVSLKNFNSQKEATSSSIFKSAKKPLVPKFKQGSTSATTSKSSIVPSTSTFHKAHKSHGVVKNKVKIPAAYSGLKFKQKFGVTVKATKLKPSAIYGSKYSKLESPSVSKEESPDKSNKKKIEKGHSSAVSRKPFKVESATASSVPKRPLKKDGNGSKVVKTDLAVCSQKKVKYYSGRKRKVTTPTHNTKPKKIENSNFIKKRNKSDSMPTFKQPKSDFKISSHSTKVQESETPPSGGSRKSSSAVKAKIESNKKPSRMKSDESLKRIPAAVTRKATSMDSTKKVGLSTKQCRL